MDLSEAGHFEGTCGHDALGNDEKDRKADAEVRPRSGTEPLVSGTCWAVRQLPLNPTCFSALEQRPAASATATHGPANERAHHQVSELGVCWSAGSWVVMSRRLAAMAMRSRSSTS